MFTVSEIYLRFPKYVSGFRNMFTVFEIHVTYPGVGSLRGDPRRLRGYPQPAGASCHAPVTAGSLKGSVEAGAGRLPRAGGVWGGPPYQIKNYSSIS
jgi:hypothetical protein